MSEPDARVDLAAALSTDATASSATTGRFTVRRVAIVVALAAAWCALWGSVTPANVAGGVVVGTVASFAGGPAVGGVRVVPLARLLWLVAIDLVESTGVVVREVLTPTDYTDEAIVAFDIPDVGRRHLLFLYIAITVTPGTAVVAADRGASTMFLHLLHGDRADDVIEHVEVLATLVGRAFPVPAIVVESGEVGR